ncbi:MAG: hypothetical protein AAF958_01835 [Planctomycetota bacterium]
MPRDARRSVPKEMMKLYLFLAASILSCTICVAQDPVADQIQKAIGQLDDNNSRVRSDAAELLAEIDKLDDISPIKKRLKIESDFHVRLVLNYAVASQGEKSGIEPLIKSLSQTGHLGCVYLRRVTGRDLGWNADKYQKWFDRTSDKEFKAFVDERWRRKPMMEEFAEFASLYSKQFFGSMKSDDEDSIFPDMRLTETDKQRLKTLPTAKAWAAFQTGLTELQENGNRKEAARHFRFVATQYDNTYYADDSRELADLLDKMVAEESKFKKPKDVDKLDLESKIKLRIYQLRDVVAYQFTQPGYCHVFGGFTLPAENLGEPKKRPYNAAISLREIGEPAIPYLIEILDDRRPIRGVGYWRDFRPTRTVLRYQDAAIQIIDAIRSGSAYDRQTTGSYFSTEQPEKRKEIIEALRAKK